MTALPEPTVKAVAYTVSLLDEDDVNFKLHAVQVTYWAAGQWAVVHLDECLGLDGTWDDGIKPYGRGDTWLSTHRFDERTALDLAKTYAHTATVNGITTADLLKLKQARDG